MAGVFLSYDHEDADRASRVASALEKAGHSVWWDRHIHSGAEYNSVIEGAVKSADVVVVLWSERSVSSAWVRDEAAEGRDEGKLVPVALDGTKPPLGFRQFQTLDLSPWTGRGRVPRLTELLAAINAHSGGRGTGAELASATVALPEHWWRVRWPVAAVAGTALLLAISFAVWMMIARSGSVPVVAVAPADPSSASQELSRDLLVKLGSLQASDPNALQLAPQDDRRRTPTLLFNVSARVESGRPEATLALLGGRDRLLLWSRGFEQPSGKIADLKQQIAYTAAQVLACASEGLSAPGRKLSRQVLKIYLSGCASFADKTSGNLDELLPRFREVTRKAPDFPGGWAKLLLVESEFARMSHVPEAAAIVAELPGHIAMALKVDPGMPEALIAEAALLPDKAFERRMRLLQQAVDNDPDNGPALAVLSDNLLHVGRMNDAVDRAQRAVRLNPLSPTTRDSLVAALTYAGKADAADAELRKAEQLWPGASSVIRARYRIHLRYGDPGEALRLIRSGDVSISNDPYNESFLEARIDPTPAKVDRAVREAQSYYNRYPTVIYHLAQVLGTFGREEELFPILLKWPHPEEVSYVADVLFRPALRNVQRDPRMMAVAERLGLLKYWEHTGKWPDLCFEPGLPYDCKKEAAKLTA